MDKQELTIELVMALLIVFASAVLVVVLMLGSSGFVNAIRGAGESFEFVVDFIVGVGPTTSTTLAPETAQTTSTTLEQTSTSTTRVTFTTTSSTSTTTTIPTTSTTIDVACNDDFDCGGLVIQYRCKSNTVYNYSTQYWCQNPGSSAARCFGKPKTPKPVEKCQEYQDCVDGVCENLYNNECDYECDLAGYDSYYCSDTCIYNGTMISLDKDCSFTRKRCCCVE